MEKYLMKPVLTRQFHYTGDVYGYTIQTITGPNDEPTEIKDYQTTPTEVKMALSINLLGELVIDTLTKIQLNAYIMNVKDRNGKLIYENGTKPAKWEVVQTMPLLSTLGTVEGYRFRAKLIEGQD